MSPQELDLVCLLIAHSAKTGYDIGRDDEKAGKPVDYQRFANTAGKRMLIQKEINKTRKKR